MEEAILKHVAVLAVALDGPSVRIFCALGSVFTEAQSLSVGQGLLQPQSLWVGFLCLLFALLAGRVIIQGLLHTRKVLYD